MSGPRFGVYEDGCEGIKANGRTCNFIVAYNVMTDSGVVRLCSGCAADLRLKGEKAVFVRGRIAA